MKRRRKEFRKGGLDRGRTRQRQRDEGGESTELRSGTCTRARGIAHACAKTCQHCPAASAPLQQRAKELLLDTCSHASAPQRKISPHVLEPQITTNPASRQHLLTT
eukprot:6204989-Pleurochrysis_carterae.AAC.2